MAFPPNWPPNRPDNIRSLRFFEEGTASGNFEDNAWLFQTYDANPSQATCSTIIIKAAGALEYSFDGVDTHGKVAAGETLVLRQRYEGGISVKGSGAFTITAW